MISIPYSLLSILQRNQFLTRFDGACASCRPSSLPQYPSTSPLYTPQNTLSIISNFYIYTSMHLYCYFLLYTLFVLFLFKSKDILIHELKLIHNIYIIGNITSNIVSTLFLNDENNFIHSYFILFWMHVHIWDKT